MSVEISSLQPADSPRLEGENPQHVELLARVESRLPPILVDRVTMRVIDGMHRLRAAQLRGDTFIEARFYEGVAADEFVEAVRQNTRHGLPLSQQDRSAAAVRIMRSHPSWSDRRIASVAGLAPATVGTLRRSSDQIGHLNTRRVGRDGRSRPVDAAAGRERAERFLADHPEASVREVAAAAGIAPATAMDVRERLRQGLDPVPDSQRRRNVPVGITRHRTGGNMPQRPTSGWQHTKSMVLRLRRDPALRLTEQGRALLRLLSVQADEQQWALLAEIVPAHRSELVARVARQCAAGWLSLADALEARRSEGPRAG
ncbi:ParB/RepB/Spo0J family partition protein [Streptomyces sp. B6B3]|uniref:ParB/RepB/Spo0J family partition protein n=1 Tax=Streptomyces sp. B6B3 TaxID=3153570 RepID=UPI00325CC600